MSSNLPPGDLSLQSNPEERKEIMYEMFTATLFAISHKKGNQEKTVSIDYGISTY